MTTFAFFSCYAQFSPLLIETKTAATAVLLLNSLEEDVLVKACNGICTFAEKGTADLFLNYIYATSSVCSISSLHRCGQ